MKNIKLDAQCLTQIITLKFGKKDIFTLILVDRVDRRRTEKEGEILTSPLNKS